MKKCWCNKGNGTACNGRGVASKTLEGTGKKANLCTAHREVYKNRGLGALSFHTNPVPVLNDTQDELPFKMSRNATLEARAKAQAELEEAMKNSRVISTIEEGVPGVHRAPEPSNFIIAGTGARALQTASVEAKKEAKARVMAEIAASKANHGDNLVIMSGMAEGFDRLIAVCAIVAEVRLWCAIPNKGYADYYWARNSLTGKPQQAAFDAIVGNAEKVVYVMEDVHQATGSGVYWDSQSNTMSWNSRHGRHSNFVRNDYMVKEANAFWIWDASSSGTADCVTSIKAAGKPYRVLSDN